jgi:hypothetical protein
MIRVSLTVSLSAEQLIRFVQTAMLFAVWFIKQTVGAAAALAAAALGSRSPPSQGIFMNQAKSKRLVRHLAAIKAHITRHKVARKNHTAEIKRLTALLATDSGLSK